MKKPFYKSHACSTPSFDMEREPTGCTYVTPMEFATIIDNCLSHGGRKFVGANRNASEVVKA
jgi:hypothetical protein